MVLAIDIEVYTSVMATTVYPSYSLCMNKRERYVMSDHPSVLAINIEVYPWLPLSIHVVLYIE